MWNDNVTIFDEIAKSNADLMMTDSSETRYLQKQYAKSMRPGSIDSGIDGPVFAGN
jgi:hypothetical protein